MLEISGKEILSKLDRQIEAQSDLRYKVPSLVLIYPLDQNYLKATFAGQKWMLKLCCMAPGHEHLLHEMDAKETESNPALGWYRLEDLGELTGPIIKWMKSKESFLKVVSPRLGAALEWVHQDTVTTFLKEQGESAKNLKLPESSLPQGGNNMLPVTSEWIRLTGLDERDYRQVEGQGLVFLQKVLEKSPCGNLRPFYHRERMLWLCNEHWQQMDSERKVVLSATNTSRPVEEILDNYRRWLEGRVSKVRLLGDAKKHELTKVFVDLTIVEDRMRPSSRTEAEYWGLLDKVLRKLRNPFATELEEELRRDRRRKTTVKPDDLLRPKSRAVIVGAPGSGKSTLLRYLVYKTLQQGERLPVFLELKNIERADLERARGNLAELIFHRSFPNDPCEDEAERRALRRDFFVKLKAGQISIFLDGLDEVSGTDFFKEIRQSFRDFLEATEYQNNTLIISTRPYALRDRFSRDEAQEMEIAPLDEEQVEQFIEHYYENDAMAQKFVKEMRTRRVLKELARVPALLGFLVHLYHEEGAVSEDKLELYRRMVDHLIRVWDEEKGAKREFRIPSPTRRREFLKHLAFTNLIAQQDREDSKRLVFTDEQILREAQCYCHELDLPTNPDDLAEDVKATPLLREIGANTYTFAHLTVQEFLAADALAAQANCESLFCRAYFSPTLSEMEVLPMTLGLSTQANELYSALEHLPDSLNYTNVRLRARGLGYAAQINEPHLSRLTERFIAFVTKQDKKEAGYVEIVTQAFSGIVGQARKSIANRLLKFLEDEDSDLRQQAASTLGNFGGIEAVDSLRRVMGDTDTEVQQSAAYALGKIGGTEAVAALKLALQASESWVRESAASALGEIGATEAIPALQMALQDQSSDVRQSVVSALGEIGGPEVIPALHMALQDQSSGVRESAANALGQIGATEAISALQMALQDQSSDVRQSAVGALGEIGGAQVIPSLQIALQDQNSDVRQRAVSAFGKIGGAEAVIALKLALQDQDSWVRHRAAYTLGEIGGTEVISALQLALQDQTSWVQESAAIALGIIGGTEAVVILKLALQDEKTWVRQSVAAALVEIGGADAIAALQSALQDQSSIVRRSAVTALGKIGGAEAVSALQSVLKDRDSSVRREVAEALGRIGTEEALNALHILRQDKTKSVRELADDLIHNTEGKKAVRMLRISLSDDFVDGIGSLDIDPAEELAELEGLSLVSGLQQSLDDDDRKVRQRAASVIGYYAHDEQVIAQLSDLANNDPITEVKEAACDALTKIARKRRYFGLETEQ